MQHFPMLRHLTQPFDAGRLELDRSIKAARDSVIDDAQLLFGQQLDKLALGLDKSGNAHILGAQVGDDLLLLTQGRKQNLESTNDCTVKSSLITTTSIISVKLIRRT